MKLKMSLLVCSFFLLSCTHSKKTVALIIPDLSIRGGVDAQGAYVVTLKSHENKLLAEHKKDSGFWSNEGLGGVFLGAIKNQALGMIGDNPLVSSVLGIAGTLYAGKKGVGVYKETKDLRGENMVLKNGIIEEATNTNSGIMNHEVIKIVNSDPNVGNVAHTS